MLNIYIYCGVEATTFLLTFVLARLFVTHGYIHTTIARSPTDIDVQAKHHNLLFGGNHFY